MKIFFTALLLFFTVLSAETLPSYRIQAKSKQVKGSSIRLVTSEAHYAQPPDQVWKLLNDFHSFPKFIPRLKTFESLGVAHASEQVYLAMDLPIPFPDLWNVIALTRDETKHRFEWKMLQGNMNTNIGDLLVEAEGSGSCVRLEVQADPGLFLPHWVIAWGAKNFLPKILQAVGQQLDHSTDANKPLIQQTPAATLTAKP